MVAHLPTSCLYSLLRPIARFFLRRALAFQDFLQIAKRVFVEVAAEEIRAAGGKVNPSRIIASTGIHRNEVKQLLEEGLNNEPRYIGIAGRIVSQWEHDRRFCDRTGTPRALTFGGEKNEFESLVRSVDSHLTPGTVLFELERLQLVKKANDRLKLIGRTEVVRADPLKLFELLARDINTLIRTTEENMVGSDPVPNLHILTDYDNVYRDSLPKIRAFLLEEGRAFHKRMRDFIANHDADMSPDATRIADAGKRVTIGTFSLVESDREETGRQKLRAMSTPR